ncbi:unnamed protein product [Symbiodinium microadriaticum]|nr:unnamed protein product [Symbiodinium microadriaticum]CAE7922298.1 unnamed protein product [Symbiodinium sp. KB8]
MHMSHAVSVLCRRKGVSVRTQSNLSFQCEILAALHTAVMKLPGLDVGAFKRPGDLLFWRHLETSSALVLGQAPAAQRLIIFGAPLHELPCISQGLVDGGLESHHAYGKALRMGTTQVLGRLEAILLALAEESSAKAAAARPLAEAVLELLRQARIRMDDAEERKTRVSLIRSWAEGVWQEGQDIQSLVTKSAEDLAEQLQLKPLERKRLLAAVAEGPQTQEEDGQTAELSLAEDAAVRYRRLRPLVDRVAKELPAGLDPAAAADEDVAMLLAILRVKSQRALES